MNKLAGAVVAMSIAAAAGADGPPRFVYVDTGTVSQNSPLTEAWDINDAGFTTGTSFEHFENPNPNSEYWLFVGRAFVFTPDNEFINLGDNPAIATPYTNRGRSINSSNEIVGEAIFAHMINPSNFGNVFAPPTMWIGQDVFSLGLPDGVVGGIAEAINDHGQAVGHIGINFDTNPPTYFRAFATVNGQSQILSQFGGFSRANDINNSGHIIGKATFNGDLPREFLLRDRKIVDLGGWLPQGTFEFGATPEALNDLDQIVGQSPLGATVWEDGSAISLPAFEDAPCFFAWDINEFGDVVGGCSDYRPALWKEGALYNINDLVRGVPDGYVIDRLNAINNPGQIVGWSASTTSLDERAFRLDPVTPDLSGDGVVDGVDLARLLSAWGSDDPYIDLDGDGVVNTADLTDLLLHWGPVPERTPYFWTK